MSYPIKVTRSIYRQIDLTKNSQKRSNSWKSVNYTNENRILLLLALGVSTPNSVLELNQSLIGVDDCHN